MNDKIDYNDISKNYSVNRNASIKVAGHILKIIIKKNIDKILEAGCGTADYLGALANALRCNSYGFDNSEGMIKEANIKNRGLNLKVNDLHESFKYPAGYFDLVYSVDVIHYVKEPDYYFKECRKVLKNNGMIITITDSEKDLKNRTMTKYFPESLEIEKKRYPEVKTIIKYMKQNGFKKIKTTHTKKTVKADENLLQKFRNRSYSVLRLISDESFKRGIKRMEEDFINDRCFVKELYTYIWGVKPR